MIGVLSQGRLGNQMFQLAFAFVTGKKLEAPFFIYKANSLHYFELFHDFETINENRIKAYISTNFWQKSRASMFKDGYKAWGVNKNVKVWNNLIGSEKYLLEKLEDNCLYDGYFQSEEYYTDFKEEIRELFKIKVEHENSFKSVKDKLFAKKVVAVHIRRTDYVNYGDESLGGTDLTLPVSFYKRSLALIENIENYNVVFVSDDIDFVKKQFGEKSNYFFESNSEIVDFQILLHAHIVVIANSSFSWWAAWLNRNENKIVYAPNYFSGFKIKKFYPSGIKVKDWNWIDVE